MKTATIGGREFEIGAEYDLDADIHHRPMPTETCNVDELKRSGMVGLYRREKAA